MKKSQAIFLVLASTVLALILNIFIGRWLAVKLSTWPLLNRWKLLSPQGAIVINTKEEVRVSDSGDTLQAINLVKSKLSSVAVRNAGQISYAGGAVNLTSDGLFLTTKSVIGSARPENIFVKLDEGGILSVQNVVSDPLGSLVILKTVGANVPAANLGNSKSLAAGEKIIFVANSFLDSSPFFENNFVTASQLNDYQTIKDADTPSRAFKLQNQDQLINGTAVVNLSGEVVGLWDTGNVISADVVKDLLSNYFSSNGQLARPAWGFKYRDVSPAESAILGQPPEAKVVQVGVNAPAQKGGLQVNDLILSVDGDNLSTNTDLEELLQKYHPGSTATLTVLRGKDKLNLNLIAGQAR